MRTTNQQYLHDNPEQLVAELHSDWETGNDAPSDLLAQFALAQAKSQGCTGRALFIGCGTGRGAVTLAKGFPDLLAVDSNGRFIDTCLKLHAGEVINLSKGFQAAFPQNVNMSQVIFKQVGHYKCENANFSVNCSICWDLLESERFILTIRNVFLTMNLYLKFVINNTTKLFYS